MANNGNEASSGSLKRHRWFPGTMSNSTESTSAVAANGFFSDGFQAQEGHGGDDGMHGGAIFGNPVKKARYNDHEMTD